jgi:hypothetical protein
VTLILKQRNQLMKLNKILLAAVVLASVVSNANAALTTVDNGLGVYDSALNVTWATNGNLLQTMESQQGSLNVINAIIAASPVVHDTPNAYDNNGPGNYNVSINNFGGGGLTDWYGAQAFINYLNVINYGNSKQWALPSSGTNPQANFNQTSSQLGELYYNELGAVALDSNSAPASQHFGILGKGYGAMYQAGNPGPFTNVQAQTYWSGTEFTSPSILTAGPVFAWYFSTQTGYQFETNKILGPYYIWPVSPGLIQASAPVPLPASIWLFGYGIMGLLGLNRQRKVSFRRVV